MNRLALTVGLALALASCAATEPDPRPSTADAVATAASMYRGGPERTGRFPGPGPEGAIAEHWRVDVGSAVRSQPAVVDGTVYLTTDGGAILAIDSQTGKERWSHDAGDGLASSPAVVDGLVVAVTMGGRVLAVDAVSGAEVWRLDKDAAPESMPAVAEGMVYLGTDAATLLALDLRTGEEVWSYEAEAPVARSAAVGGGRVFVGSADGRLHAVDADTGSRVWTHDTAGGVVGTPAIGNGLVYAVNLSEPHSQVIALHAESGEEAWRFAPDDAAGLRPIVLGPDAVYAVDSGGAIHALDPLSGAARWSYSQDSEISAAPALVDSHLYVLARDRAFAFDITTQDEAWTIELDGKGDYGPVVADGVVYAGTNAGVLYAIGSEADAPAGSDPSPTADAAVSDVAVLDREVSTPDDVEYVVSVAAAPDGRLYLVDLLNGRILVSDGDSRFSAGFGEPGSEPGQLDFIRDDNDPFNSIGDVAVAPDGTVWVANADNFRVEQFSAEGAYLGSIGQFGPGDGQFLDPIGVAIADDGSVFVVDDERDVIQRFAPDGTFELSFGGHGISPGQLNFTGMVTLDADGNVWIADYGNHRIQAFSPDGDFITTFGSRGAELGMVNAPNDVAVDAHGRVWVADSDNLRVQVFTADGAPVGQVKLPGLGVAAAPSSVTIHGEELYVTRFTNPEILVYRILPPDG
jgi:outer membrane protein assembly factor BamB